MDRTQRNLWSAFLGEAKTNRLYVAYALKAMDEGHPEVAQVFMEAAGAETIHALNHLRVMTEVKSSLENLKTVTEGEAYEFETMYPRMVAAALEDGRQDAAATFRVALEGEKRHLANFLKALSDLERKTGRKAPSLERPAPPAPTPAQPPLMAEKVSEVDTEKGRIAALTRIREVVFGMQDGLLTTATLGAAIAAATDSSRTVVIAGLAGALGGMMSMSAGAFLGSRAEREVRESELAREAREIATKPEEELAELIEIYRREGFRYDEAVEMAERVAQDPDLMLRTLAEKELGLSTDVEASPAKDAVAMGTSYIIGAMLPLIPYFFLEDITAVLSSIVIAVSTLFVMGVAKARFTRRNPLLSGAEIMAIGTVVAAAGYGLGVVFPSP
ncbi:MAG: VIT1/CCC1 transporter family protein [Dehalococcoidia bacterium]